MESDGHNKISGKNKKTVSKALVGGVRGNVKSSVMFMSGLSVR